jgi:histidine ammonia-lyase
METLALDGSSLKCSDLIKVYNDCDGKVKVVVQDSAKEKIHRARAGVEKKIKCGETVYGTNTDVSALKSAPPPGSAAQAAANIIQLYICVFLVLIWQLYRTGREKLYINLDSMVFVCRVKEI